MIAPRSDQDMTTPSGWVLRWLAAAVISVTLLVAGMRTPWLEPLEDTVHQWVFQPLTSTLQLPFRLLTFSLSGWQQQHAAMKRTGELLSENQQLRTQVQLMGHYQAENRRLRMLMDSVATVSEPVMVAELENTNIEGYRETVTINKGSRDGVSLHQSVIDPFGMVGQTIEVYPHQAVVMLVSDARSRVPVYVERTHQRALVSGSSEKGVLTMPLLRLDEDVKVGDRLVSSGLGGVFPRGYPVAEITAIDRDQSNSFMKVALRPLAEIHSLLEVLLIDQRNVPVAYSREHDVPVGPPLPIIPETVIEEETP